MSELYFEYGEQELNHLRKCDKKLGAAIDRIGIIKRKVNPNVFAALVESIIAQQISTKAASTVTNRLATLCGTDFAELYGLTTQDIQTCGMSMRKADYIKGIADTAASGTIDFSVLHKMDDLEIIKTLTKLNGVGVWTAEMLLIFSLMRPNVVSYGDLAIRRGMMRLYGLKSLPKDKFARYAKRYAPYGSVTSLYLWEISSQEE